MTTVTTVATVVTATTEDVLTDLDEQGQGFTDFITFDDVKVVITRYTVEKYFKEYLVTIDAFEVGLESLFSCIEDGMKPDKMLSKFFHSKEEAVAYVTELIKNHGRKDA